MPKEDNEIMRSAEILLEQVGSLRLAEENARTADDFEPISLLLLGAVKKETFRSGESETRTSKLKRIRTC